MLRAARPGAKLCVLHAPFNAYAVRTPAMSGAGGHESKGGGRALIGLQPGVVRCNLANRPYN